MDAPKYDKKAEEKINRVYRDVKILHFYIYIDYFMQIKVKIFYFTLICSIFKK